MWLYERRLLIVFNHPARFGGNRQCGRGDILLLYHVTSPEHMPKWFCDLMVEIIVNHPLASFGDHRPCVSRDITDLIFHVA